MPERRVGTEDVPLQNWRERIKRTRQILGLTQKKFAETIGVQSQSYVSDLEHGRVQPSLDVVRRLHPLMEKALAEDLVAAPVFRAPRRKIVPSLHPAVAELVKACDRLSAAEVNILTQIATHFRDVRGRLRDGVKIPVIGEARPTGGKESDRGPRNSSSSVEG